MGNLNRPPWPVSRTLQISIADVAPSQQAARAAPGLRHSDDHADLYREEETGRGGEGEGRLAEVLPVAVDRLTLVLHPEEVVLARFLLRRR